MEESKQSSLGKYCEVSTCMGVVDCYLTKSVLGKLFWSTLIVFGLSLTVFQTYLTFAEYFNESDFTSSISKEIEEHGIMFPQITICNFNRAKQSVINATKIDPKTLTAMFQMIPVTYDLPLSYADPSMVPMYQNALTKYLTDTGDTSVKNFFRKYGHPANESVILGTYGIGTTIFPDNFTEVFTVYGRCWRLDLNDTQQIPGSFAGIKLVLNPQINEYMTNVIINNFFQQGFAISLDYNDAPIMSDALTLAPGTAASIVLKSTRNSFGESQFAIKTKPCRKNMALSILSAGYTQINCNFDCYMQAINLTCGCMLLMETRLNNIPICNLSESIRCGNANPIDQMQSIWWAQNVGSKIGDCAKYCQNPCEDYMTIETSMSTTKISINDKTQAIQLLEGLGKEEQWTQEFVADAVENLVLAKIFFSTTDLAIIETDETTTVMTFIGNVGGQLGLWVGISMFSIIQFLYYVFIGCVSGDCYYHPKKVQNVPTKLSKAMICK